MKIFGFLRFNFEINYNDVIIMSNKRLDLIFILDDNKSTSSSGRKKAVRFSVPQEDYLQDD